MYQLSNDQLRINVNSKGAELCSIYSPNFDIEYIWQADPAFWGRHAPVLFPIVGKLKDDTYYHHNKAYHMPQHGFARDKEFTLIDESKNSLRFSLKADEDTLLIYPFKFELQIEYRLDGTKLEVIYSVSNKDKGMIWFSIGAHPAFNCPLVKDTKWEDYAFNFSSKEYASRHLIENGLQTGQEQVILREQGQLLLNKNTFEKDALVFKQLRSSVISLVNNKNKHGLSINFEGFPYLGLWSKPDAPFVCIEPWHGIADHEQSDQQLVNKEGIITLLPEQSFVSEYIIDLF